MNTAMRATATITLVFGILLCAPGANAKTTEWTYTGDNGATGAYRETVTLVISKRPGGYEVGGEYVFNSYLHNKTCRISGTYFPAGRRLRAVCESSDGEEHVISGTRRTDRDQFQIQLGLTGNVMLAKCAGACMGNEGSATPAPSPSPSRTPRARRPVQTGSVVTAAPGGNGWTANAISYRGNNGRHYSYTCPPNGREGLVWGTDVYTDDSSVCTAAVHAGLISVANGGRVVIEIRPGQSSYLGSDRNGIRTSAMGSFRGSFVFVR